MSIEYDSDGHVVCLDYDKDYAAKLVHRATQIRLEQQQHPALLDPQVIRGIQEQKKILIPYDRLCSIDEQLVALCAKIETEIADLRSCSIGWHVRNWWRWSIVLLTGQN